MSSLIWKVRWGQPWPYHSESFEQPTTICRLDLVFPPLSLRCVYDTVMGTRFHQLGLNTFNDIIPGELPSNKDRKKFREPDIGDKSTSEHDISVELVRFHFLCLYNRLILMIL